MNPKLTLVALATTSWLGAQAPSYRSRILGVYDAATLEPIVDAQVTDVASHSFSRTTRTGTVSLAFLPDGGGYVTVKRVGYESWMGFVAISPHDTTPLTIVLKGTTPVLPPIVARDTDPKHISPALQSFDERRKGGFGQFIDETELRKNDNRELPEVLRKLSNIDIKCSYHTPRKCFAFSKTQGIGHCSNGALVYLDGIVINDSNLLLYQTSEIGGVETYSPATVPAQYNKQNAACGVVLLWTRER